MNSQEASAALPLRTCPSPSHSSSVRFDVVGREAERQPDGLIRITLKRAESDGTLAVDMDPLSLLCRLAMSVPPPRFHTVKYSGVLASASR
jgi:hypothetical protein